MENGSMITMVHSMEEMVKYFTDRGIKVIKTYNARSKMYEFTLFKSGIGKTYFFKYPETHDIFKRHKEMTEACEAAFKNFQEYIALRIHLDLPGSDEMRVHINEDIRATDCVWPKVNPYIKKPLEPVKVHFSGPCTIVIWNDGTKTVVKCSENDIYDPEKGLAMAFAKKMFGNDNSFHKLFAKWLPKEEPKVFEIKLTPGQDNSEAVEQIETLQQRLYRALGITHLKEEDK